MFDADPLKASRKHERMEAAFCNLLAGSGYAALQDAHDCSIRFSHNGSDEDPDYVATSVKQAL